MQAGYRTLGCAYEGPVEEDPHVSRLDTSQQITDDASLHAEEFHVRSHPKEKPTATAGAYDGEEDGSAAASPGDRRRLTGYTDEDRPRVARAVAAPDWPNRWMP